MFKVYDKRAEIEANFKKKGRGEALPPELMDWCSGVVRFELTLRGQEFDNVKEPVLRLHGPTATAAALSIWQTYYDRITWNGNATMSDRGLLESALPGHVRLKLEAWRGGADLRQMMSTPTWYRVRREIHSVTGIDIASPPPKREASSDPIRSTLDPDRWDPEPIKQYLVEPDPELSRQYGLSL
jgi:hypothetical protein